MYVGYYLKRSERLKNMILTTKEQIINYIIYYQVIYNIIVSINMQNTIEMHVNIYVFHQFIK